MKYEYSENVLVQDSAAALMHDELGWDVVFAYNTEVLGDNGTLGRKDYHEIVLWRYFNAALKKLNPWITDTQITEARQTLTSYLSSESLLQINEEKYFLIRDGIPVTVKKPNGKNETKIHCRPDIKRRYYRILYGQKRDPQGGFKQENLS